MDEFEVIRRYFSGVGALREDVDFGVGDDAAVVRVPKGCELLLTTDSLNAGIHFPAQDFPPEALGHRALAASLSDIAAMGGEPAWAMLALTLPAAEPPWFQAFTTGFARLAERHEVALVGGNLARGPLSVTVAVAGFVAAGTALARGLGRAGDRLFVTGRLGGGRSGLRALAAGAPIDSPEVLSYSRPEPRIHAARVLAGYAHAAIDVSDGLLGDLAKVLRASGDLGAALESAAIPLAAGASLADALGPSDDYELLVSVPRDAAGGIEAVAAGRIGCNLTCIGELTAEPGILLDGHPVAAATVAGFRHFE